jgi:hypothetical protein
MADPNRRMYGLGIATDPPEGHETIAGAEAPEAPAAGRLVATCQHSRQKVDSSLTVHQL